MRRHPPKLRGLSRDASSLMPAAEHPLTVPRQAERSSSVPSTVANVARGVELTASRYHNVMAGRQTTIRLPEALAVETEAVARVLGVSVNSLIIDALEAEMARIRKDKRFAAKAKELLKSR